MSKYGDDILQTACLKGNLSIFNYLMENVRFGTKSFLVTFYLYFQRNCS
ncbi:MAG: hypothetical protein ACK56I_08320, partial [bacterium]